LAYTTLDRLCAVFLYNKYYNRVEEQFRATGTWVR